MVVLLEMDSCFTHKKQRISGLKDDTISCNVVELYQEEISAEFAIKFITERLL